MSTTILVIGASGQLGKTIEELFSINNDALQFTFTTKTELDITIQNKVEEFFNQHNFDYCINCAAYTNVEQAEVDSEPAFLVNAEGVKNLAEACKRTNIVLIHISTDYVFDGKKREPYVESDIPNPINEYGKSKLLGEQYIQEISQKYFIIRTSWLYSKYGNNFVKSIINKIRENIELKIITSQKGTPTSCVNLSNFIYFLIKINNANYGIYNFSAIGETTWYDFAIHISNSLNLNKQPSIIPTKTATFKANRPQYSVLNNNKSQQIFPIEFHWKKSVTDVVENLVIRN